MARLLRAALYLPTGQRDGRHVAGPDEDPFTLVATALERALAVLERPVRPIRVEWLGEECRDLDWAIPLVLGTSSEVVRYPGDGSALRDACERARQETDRVSIVFGSDLYVEGSDPPKSVGNSSHDGGFAWVFSPEGSLDVPEVLRAIPLGTSPLQSAIAVRREMAGRSPHSVWGQEEEGPGRQRTLAPAPPTLPDRVRSVSEGAYVPRARYLENLPSRWRFVAEQCGACRAYTFPTRGRCRACGRTEDLEARELPRDGGLVVASTIIGPGGQPTEFDPVVETFGPYQVVLAELAPGARVPLQVTDATPGEIRIGDRIGTRLRRLYAMEGEWRYGRKAVPTQSAGPLLR